MDALQIRFGTDGWRGIIADDFTFDNVRACAQGIATYQLQLETHGAPIVVGYDTRFASEDFANAVAEVLAGNGLEVLLCVGPNPTPIVSFTVVNEKAPAGIIITASHNPAQWNGLKYRTYYGGSPPPEVLAAIEGHIARLRESKTVRHLMLSDARSRGLVRNIDPRAPYLRHLSSNIELQRLQHSGLSVVVDAMHGAGAGIYAALLAGSKGNFREIRAERNPAFPGMQNPEPIAVNLGRLSQAVLEEGADIGLALDGDADRLGAVDENGTFVTPLQVFALLIYYLLEVRGLRGMIVKSLTTTSMTWHLAERYGVPVRETPVGFKYIAPVLVDEDALIGGEESGGYAFRGHLPERDGILSGLYLLDLMAITGKRLSELIQDLYKLVGPHHYSRLDIPLQREGQQVIRARMDSARPDTIAGYSVLSQDCVDGYRFHLEGGGWVLIRASGTEPLLRIYAESESPESVQDILKAAQRMMGV
jgi:phosphomannomutase